LAEVDPAPAGHENKRAVVRGVLPILVELGMGLGIGLIDDHRAKIVGVQLARIAARDRGLAAHFGDVASQHLLSGGGDKDAFRMPGGEGFSRT